MTNLNKKCHVCGVPLVLGQNINLTRIRRYEWLCGKCRYKRWGYRYQKITHNGAKTCVVCQKEFVPQTGGKTWERACYCSRKCAKWAYRRSETGRKARYEYQRRYMQTPEGRRKFRNNHLKRKTGISLDQKEARWRKQKGKCAICGANLSENMSLCHTDHDHAANMVRGILCSGCNRGLGCFRDSPEALRLAATYLEKFYQKFLTIDGH